MLTVKEDKMVLMWILSAVLLFIAGVVGWILNIVQLFYIPEFSGMVAVRILGVVIPFLGAVLGYI